MRTPSISKIIASYLSTQNFSLHSNTELTKNNFYNFLYLLEAQLKGLLCYNTNRQTSFTIVLYALVNNSFLYRESSHQTYAVLSLMG
jgi:hypothetical protein